MKPLSHPVFSEWLLAEMNKRQWSQSDLARAADLSRAVINKLLNQRTYPRPTTLAAIARAFRIPVETAYRAAGLLPKASEAEEFEAEITHKLSLIQDPKRKATAMRLLRALIEEEENEKAERKN